MKKKCTSALQEFLESSLNEGYPDPECSQRSFGKFDWKIKPSARFEVVEMTKARQNSTAFLADNSLLEARMGTDD